MQWSSLHYLTVCSHCFQPWQSLCVEFTVCVSTLHWITWWSLCEILRGCMCVQHWPCWSVSEMCWGCVCVRQGGDCVCVGQGVKAFPHPSLAAFDLLLVFVWHTGFFLSRVVTYLCPSLPVEHRLSTTPRHRTLFWAALVIPDQLVPCFSSASVSRLQLLQGRPLFLFPCRFQVRAWHVVLDAGFLRVCPIQPHFLRSICLTTGSCPARSHSQELLALFNPFGRGWNSSLVVCGDHCPAWCSVGGSILLLVM